MYHLFEAAQLFFLQIYNSDQAMYNYILSAVLPGIEKLATGLQPERFRILKAGHEGKVELTKRQIAQILANGFFCNFKKDINVPRINFDKFEYSSFSPIKL
jgi:Poly (ADP-ribose) glycohydrolase (PARG)